MYRLVGTVCCIALLFAAACGPKCGFADQVVVLDHKDGLFLVYRMTGMQEKVEFFELYREKPVFDVCGAASMDPIATEMYERCEGLLKGVRARDNHLTLVLASKPSEATEARRARLLP